MQYTSNLVPKLDTILSKHKRIPRQGQPFHVTEHCQTIDSRNFRLPHNPYITKISLDRQLPTASLGTTHFCPGIRMSWASDRTCCDPSHLSVDHLQSRLSSFTSRCFGLYCLRFRINFPSLPHVFLGILSSYTFQR